MEKEESAWWGEGHTGPPIAPRRTASASLAAARASSVRGEPVASMEACDRKSVQNGERYILSGQDEPRLVGDFGSRIGCAVVPSLPHEGSGVVAASQPRTVSCVSI